MQTYVLLLSNTTSMILEKERKHQTKFGIIDTTNLKIGDIVEIGSTVFVIAEPTIIDLLPTCKRGAQIVTPKDTGQICSVTGLAPGWRCLDAGSGSGFLAIFLGNAVGPKGSVVTYEKRLDFYNLARRNIEKCELSKTVRIKNKDVASFRERNLDLICFDFKQSHTLVTRACKSLKPGRWLVIYSPHIEAQVTVLSELRDCGMYICTTMETINRKWKSDFGYTHPEPSGILHTGFMTFARRVL